MRHIIIIAALLFTTLTAVAQETTPAVTMEQYQKWYEEVFGEDENIDMFATVASTVCDDIDYLNSLNEEELDLFLLEAMRRYVAVHEADTTRAMRLTCSLVQTCGAAWLFNQGKIAEVEPLLLSAMERLRKVPDYECEPLYGQLLNKLADVYAGLSLPSKAEYYSTQLKEHCEKVRDFGRNYVMALCALATVKVQETGNRFQTAGHFPTVVLQAKALIDQALVAMREAQNLETEDKSLVLNVASMIYNACGLHSEAQAFAEQCKSYQDENIDFLDFMRLAVQQFADGNLEAAKLYIRQADDGVKRQNMLCALLNIMPLQLFAEYCTRDPLTPATAHDYFQLLMSQTAQRFPFLSAKQRSEVWAMNQVGIRMSQYVMAEEARPSELYTSALFAKGLLLRASTRVMEAATAQGGRALAVATRLRAARERQAEGRVPDDSVAILEDSVERWDKYLAQHLSGYTTPEQLMEEYSWNRIAKSLRAKEAAVEFIALPDTINAAWLVTPPMRYYALVLRRGGAAPRLVRLATAEEVSAQLSLKPRVQYGDDTFYRLLWQPLERELKGVRTIYFSPDGLLNKVAFHAINDGRKCLIDRYDLHQLTSTAAIAAGADRSPALPRTARLYGDIDYDMSNPDRCAWDTLHSAPREMQDIIETLKKKQVKVKHLGKEKATEASLHQLSADDHGLLQFITHGFYTRLSYARPTPSFADRLLDHTPDDDPMRRSGLIMAGGNRVWEDDFIAPDTIDGILSAREVATIDLRGTRLCILSACESALGDVQGSEGVFGLQRGLKQAGVEGIVMTLWKVSDSASALFMRTFYDQWALTDDRYEAFRRAREAVRSHEGYDLPDYWAPFVMLD